MNFENNDSVRSKYQKYGVKNFYKWYYDQYNNPHEPIIKKAIQYINNNWDVDFSNTLDLACGTGEVTRILVDLGYNNIEGVDAYSCDFYNKKTNKNCEPISFDDIIKGNLDDKKYSIIVCSFALHLLEPSKLPIFLYKIAQISNQLLILSPHKKPEIKEEWGWILDEEINIDKVRIRLFNNNLF